MIASSTGIDTLVVFQTSFGSASDFSTSCVIWLLISPIVSVLMEEEDCLLKLGLMSWSWQVSRRHEGFGQMCLGRWYGMVEHVHVWANNYPRLCWWKGGSCPEFDRQLVGCSGKLLQKTGNYILQMMSIPPCKPMLTMGVLKLKWYSSRGEQCSYIYVLEVWHLYCVFTLWSQPVLIRSIWSKILNINGWELSSLYTHNTPFQDIIQPLVS